MTLQSLPDLNWFALWLFLIDGLVYVSWGFAEQCMRIRTRAAVGSFIALSIWEVLEWLFSVPEHEKKKSCFGHLNRVCPLGTESMISWFSKGDTKAVLSAALPVLFIYSRKVKSVYEGDSKRKAWYPHSEGLSTSEVPWIGDNQHFLSNLANNFDYIRDVDFHRKSKLSMIIKIEVTNRFQPSSY